MNKRKVWSVVLCIAMLLTMVPASAFAAGGEGNTEQPVEAPAVFADMPQDWSTAALQSAVENGLISGYSQGAQKLIKPNGTLTRAEMGTIINNAFGASEKAGLSGVTDVPGSAWYYDQMAKAVKMGSFASASQLRPEAAITRQEVATVLAKVYQLPEAKSAALDSFADKSSVASWAKSYVAAMVENGYMSGSNGRLNPEGNVTRAEFAAMMNNLTAKYIKSPGTVDAVAESGNVMISVPGVTLKNVKVNGDLVLGDGIGAGEVTLDGVTVSGRTIIRGGGVNSILIMGNSNLNYVIIAKVDGNVRVAVSGGAKVETLVINDGKDDVIVQGSVKNLMIEAAVPVIARQAEITNLTVNAANSELTVEKDSKVTTLTVAESAEKTAVSVAGTVTTIKAEAPRTEIAAVSGAKITNVEMAKTADGSNVAIDKNASINKIDSDAKITTSGEGKASTVTGDGAVTNKETGKEEQKPSTGGGGGGGSGSSSGPSSQSVEVVKARLHDTRTEDEGFIADADLIADYEVSAVKWSNRDYTDISIKGKNLKAHQNAADNMGYWVGVAIPSPTTAAVTYSFGTSATDTATESYGDLVDMDGKNCAVFYVDAGSDTPKTHITIDWDGTGTAYAPAKYVVDISGVELAGTVRTKTELDAAIENAQNGDVITLASNIGSDSDFVVATINKAVTIKARPNVTYFGSFIVKEDGVTFQNLTIKNQGDMTGQNTEKRNAINFLGDKITIQNCVFDLAGGSTGIANGVSIFPQNGENTNYVIKENTFKGYQNSSEGYVSSGLLISGGLANKAFFEEAGTSEKAELTAEQDLAIITENTFNNCKDDYSRTDWTNGYQVFCTSVSSSDNFRLEYLKSDGKCYITGNVTRTTDAALKAGTELIVMPEAELAIAEGMTLTVEEGAVLTVNGELAGPGTVDLNDGAEYTLKEVSDVSFGVVSDEASYGSSLTPEYLAEYPWETYQESAMATMPWIAVMYNRDADCSAIKFTVQSGTSEEISADGTNTGKLEGKKAYFTINSEDNTGLPAGDCNTKLELTVDGLKIIVHAPVLSVPEMTIQELQQEVQTDSQPQ